GHSLQLRRAIHTVIDKPSGSQQAPLDCFIHPPFAAAENSLWKGTNLYQTADHPSFQGDTILKVIFLEFIAKGGSLSSPVCIGEFFIVGCTVSKSLCDVEG